MQILLGSSADAVPGASLSGAITFDATGAAVAGTLTPAGGSPSALAGGEFAVSTDGTVTGTLRAGSGDTQRTAQVVEARMLVDRMVVVGVLLGGHLLDVAGADFGLVTLVKQLLPASGTTDDLTGSWRYHELRTPAVAGQPAISLVGDVVFNPALPGTITGGTLALSDSTIETPVGVAAVAPAGAFAADLAGLLSAWELDGQIVASRDLVAGSTVVAPGAAFGLALLSRVATDVTFSATDLAGAWRLYALTLDAAQGNLGAFQRGGVVLDTAGTLTSGGFVDPDGVLTTLTAGTLSVEATGGRVTGTLAGGDATLTLDGTLRGPRDVLTAVGTLGTTTGGVSRVLLAMVPAVAVVGFNASSYTVLEGSPAQITLFRTGDTNPTAVLTLRAQSARFGNQSYEVVFVPGADRVTLPIPTVDDATSGVDAVTLSLEALPAHVVSGPPATLLIGDNEQPGTIRFAAATASVSEGASVTLQVLRAGTRLGGGVSVAWDVVGGTATPVEDFELPPTGTLTFGPGATMVPLVVPTVGDALAEGPETLVLRLRDPSSGAVLGTPIQVTVTINDNDVAGSVQFAAATARVAENAGPAVITVTRTGGAAEAVTVEYETSDGTGRADIDYAPTAGTLTFGAGVMSQTFAVPLLDNALADGDRTVRLTLRNPGGRAALGALRESVLTILDDEVGLRFGATAYTVAENGGGATITVVRTGPAVGVASVSYSTGDGTAQAGVDYTPAAGRLVFQPAERSKTFRVPVLEDGLVEGAETVLLLLSNPEGTLLGSTNTSVLTILDNDVGGTVQFEKAALTVSESSLVATVVVTRTGGLAAGVTVAYATSDGSAQAGQDYGETSGTLTFLAGERSKSLLIPVLPDRLVEGPETFQVTLGDVGGGGVLGTPAVTVVTLVDDDNGGVIKLGASTLRVSEPNDSPTALATLTVLRTGTNLASGVSVQYATADGTAVSAGGLDYVAAAGQLVFGPGETTKTIQLTIKGDVDREADETLTVTLSDPQGGATLGSPSTATVTIVDPQSSVQFERSEYQVEERAGVVTLTLVRSGPTTGTASLRYATADIAEGEPPAGHALAGLDYRAASGTITFRAGETRKTLTVPILVNASIDNAKSFLVVLSDLVGTNMGTNTPGLVTILDSARPATFELTSAASVVREGTPATMTVTRTGGTDSVVAVSWRVLEGTATTGADYPLASSAGVLTFAAGAVSRVITIPTINDSLAEGPETFTVEIFGVNRISGDAHAILGSQTTHTVTLQDDDVAGTIELSADAYPVSEGGSVSIIVRRTGGAASGVTVRLTTQDLPAGPGAATAGADYALINTVLTFGAGETTKTIPIATMADGVVEPDETFRVMLSEVGPAGLAMLGARTLATVTIVDKQPRLAFRDAVVRVTEGQTATVTVTRSGSLLGTVTVAYGPGPGTAVEGTDYAPFGNVLTFGPNVATRTFTVTTLPNGAVDGVRTLTLQLTGPDGASLGLATAELRIEDDERAGTVQFAQGAHSVVEGGTAELVIVRTAGSNGDVAVQYEIGVASTATGGGVDYTLAGGTVVLEAGRTSASVLVPTVADGLPEGTETVVVRLTGASGGAVLGSLFTTTLFIVDQEQTVAFGASAFTVGETEPQALVTVVRGGLPTGTLVVTVRTEGGTATPGLDYEPIAPTALTFGQGEIVKNVSVRIPTGAAARSGNRTVGLVLEGDPGVVANPGTTELTILDFRPDLMVVSVATPTAAFSGKILNAPMSVRNAGRVMSPPFQVGVFLARNDIPGATLPGAGTLLALESVPALMPSASVSLTTLLDLADDLPTGTYYVSAVADFGGAVGEVDEGNNGLGSAPRTIQITRGLTKLTSASATLAQGDPAPAGLSLGSRAPGGVFAADSHDGCDASGSVSLTGSFQITSQIGSLAQALARLTGTLLDLPVQYEFLLDLTIGDNNSVMGTFVITSISGAFSGTGGGAFTGELIGNSLQGGISGTINTSTPRVCAFIGTLQASGDVSFTLNLEQRTRGGVFGTAATPELELPAAIDEYSAAFRVLFDTDFPAPAVVTFTGPAGSGVTAAAASGRRSELDADGAAASYVLPPVARAGGGPGGAWSVLYKGAPRAFTIPEPGTSTRLVLAIPTVTVDPTGLLTNVSWTWADRTGVAMDPPPFVGRVRVRLTPSVGVSPLLESAPLARGNTSYALPLAVLWEDVAELAMIYQDTVTGHEYRVSYPRLHRAFAELETVHAVDKNGTRDAQVFSATFIAPVGTVSTLGAVFVSGGPLGPPAEPVPYQGRLMQGDREVDLFRLRRDIVGVAPGLGTPVTFTITPLSGPMQVLATSLRNQGTNQSIQITSPTGTLEGDAMLGIRRQVAWTLPAPSALGGFEVDTVMLSGFVRAPDDVSVCPADADQDLGPDATLGFVTLPATCAGQPVDSSTVCVVVLGTEGEQVRACQTFGPDDMVVGFDGIVQVTEGGTATVTVRRQGPTRRTATASYETRARSAQPGVDFDPVSGPLTFPPGSTVQTFSVVTLNDQQAQGPRAAELVLSNPGPGVRIFPAAVPLSINDDEQAGTIQFLQSGLKVPEGSPATLTLTRAGTNLAGNVTVDYQVVGGTAVNGVDYTLPAGTATFAAGQTSFDIAVTTFSDTLAQGIRTVIVRLGNPRPAPFALIGARAETTLSIIDDEQGGVIQFRQTGFKLTEAATTLKLDVTRTGVNLGGNVTVDYRVGAATTAVAGVDFVLAAGTLTFAAGQTSATILVSLLEDATFDQGRTLVVELANPRGGSASLGGGSRATIAIGDNEQQFQFSASSYTIAESGFAFLTVTRGGPLTGRATVAYATSDGTARVVDNDYFQASGTLTFETGQSSRTLLIQARQDTAGEGDETFSVTLSAPTLLPPTTGTAVLGPNFRATLTIADDEQIVRFAGSLTVATEGMVATITVQRAGPSSTRTLVDYATLPTTADFFATSGTLTFEPGVTSRTFTVTTRGNTLDDGTRSTTLTLSNARAIPSSIFLPPVPVFITRSTTLLFITDDDSGGVIQFAAPTLTAAETDPAVILRVTRTGTNLASGVTVDYAVVGGSAVSPGDYTLASGRLTFSAGQTSANILVDLNDDTAADGNRTVVVALSNPLNGGVLGSPSQTTLTITDNEQQIQFAASGYAVLEGSTAIITVQRSGPTTGTAFVSYATSNGTATTADYKPASGILTFGPGVTSQTFGVATGQDSLAEGTQTVTLTLSAPAPAPVVVLGPRQVVSLSIIDDDQGGTVQFTSPLFSVTEGGLASLTVSRTGTNLAGGVLVGYQVIAGGTAVDGVDYTLANGTLGFGAGQTSQTIPVQTFQNTVVDPTRSLIVRLTSFSPSPFVIAGPTVQTTLLINNDDQGGTIQFSPTTFTTSENRPIVPPFGFRLPATLSVARTGNNLASGVTVGVRVAGGTASSPTHYTLSTTTLTFGANQTTATVFVSIADNAVIDGDRTVLLELFNPQGGGALGVARFGTLIIQDDEQSVQFSASGYSVSEGGMATITVRRSGPMTAQATVQYAVITGGTATAGADYVHTSGTLTFPPGVVDVTFPVTTLQDGLFEGNETVRLQLGSPSSPVLLGTRSQTTLTIVDDEQRVRLTPTSVELNEGNSFSFIVVREGPPSGTVSVDYQTLPGSASTSDYQSVSGRLTFGPGVTSQAILIRTTTDSNPFESDETFALRLLNPSAGLLLGPNQATITINGFGF